MNVDELIRLFCRHAAVKVELVRHGDETEQEVIDQLFSYADLIGLDHDRAEELIDQAFAR